MLFDWFAGCSANSNFEHTLGICFGVLVQFALNLNSASDSASR